VAEYRLPDGRTATADPLNPEHAAWLRTVGAEEVQAQAARTPPTVGDIARLLVPSAGLHKAAGSGLAEGAARLPFLGSDLINLGLDLTQKHLAPEWMRGEGYQRFREAHKGSGWLDEGLAAVGTGFHKPQTPTEKYLNLGAQGVGGGLASVAPRALAPTARVLPLAKPTMPAELIRSTAAKVAPVAAIAGGGGALSGQALQDFTGSENPLVGLAGSLVGGLGLGWGLARTPKPQKALAEAGQATSADDWAAAERNLAKFQQSGARTATLGEAFPGDSPFLGITKEATAQAGANPLIARMAERSADLQQLSDRALNAVGREVSTDAVAAAAESAAKGRLQQFRSARTAEYGKRLAGAPALDERNVRDLHASLLDLAKAQQNSNDRAAIEAVARVLVHPEPRRVAYLVRIKEPGKPARFEQRFRSETQYKTDVGDTARELKALRDSMEYNATTASTPVKLNAHSFRQPYEIVNDFLRQAAPEHYPRAEDAFRRFSTQLITPAEKGPLGTMAGRSTAENAQVPASRMEALINRQAPEEIPRTLQSLAKGAESETALQDIGRAVLQQRVRTGEGNLGNRLAGGAAGSLGERQTQALLQSIGPNTAAFNTPVDVMRLLSRIESSAASGGMSQRAKDFGTSLGTSVVSPFQDAWVRMMLATRKTNYQKVAEILADPTPENLAKLRELAKSDPALRLRLGLGAGLSSTNTLDE
jgi:hypothetical protein